MLGQVAGPPHGRHCPLDHVASSPGPQAQLIATQFPPPLHTSRGGVGDAASPGWTEQTAHRPSHRALPGRGQGTPLHTGSWGNESAQLATLSRPCIPAWLPTPARGSLEGSGGRHGLLP